MRFRAIAAATAALLVLGTVAADASPPEPESETLQEGLAGALHLSVGPGRVVTVSEQVGSRLTNIARGRSTPFFEAPDWDVAGTDYQGSRLYLVKSQGAGPDDERPLAGSLLGIDIRGRVTTITDQLGAYETRVNPDEATQYGLSPADAAANPACVSQLAGTLAGSYPGPVETHPYAVAVTGNTAYVADAGSNAVLSISLATGVIDTLAVLPARPAEITPDVATALKAPACAGLSYRFESVPTDVEVGPDGIYVSSLPGGPENARLGARGAVHRIDPATGEAELVVDGLLSPTGIAVDGAGDVYVASLFGAGVFTVPAGTQTATLFLAAHQAADVEVSGSTLYATTEVFGNGRVVRKLL